MQDHRVVAHTPSKDLVEKWVKEYDDAYMASYNALREYYGNKKIQCVHCTKRTSFKNLKYIDVFYTDYSDPQYGQEFSHSEYTCPKCEKVNTITGDRVHLRRARRFFGSTGRRHDK